MRELLEALKRWVKFPRPSKTETKCVICGCTDSRGCEPSSREPRGCSWAYGDVDGEFGLCCKCSDERLCGLGNYMAIIAVEDGAQWKPKKTCPCPLCVASRKEKP